MKKKFICILLAATMVFSCVACGKSSDSSKSDDSKTNTSASSDNTLVVSLGSQPSSYNPDASLDDSTTQLAQCIFSGLVTMNNNEESFLILQKNGIFLMMVLLTPFIYIKV